MRATSRTPTASAFRIESLARAVFVLDRIGPLAIAPRMFFIQVAQLFQQTCQFAARFSELVFDTLHLARKLGARDQFVIEQFTQSFGENLGGDAGDESLQLTGPRDATSDGRQNGSGPLATDHILQPAIDAAVRQR